MAASASVATLAEKAQATPLALLLGLHGHDLVSSGQIMGALIVQRNKRIAALHNQSPDRRAYSVIKLAWPVISATRTS